MFLNRAYDVKTTNGDGETAEPESDRLYRVVADLYSAQMLGTVNSMSHGLLSVVPKDKDGNEITDYEEHIIYNEDGSELKEWDALAGYLDSMSSEDISEKYGQPEGRKVLNSDENLFELMKQPNKFLFMFAGIAILLIAVVVLLIVLAVKLIRRKRNKTR